MLHKIHGIGLQGLCELMPCVEAAAATHCMLLVMVLERHRAVGQANKIRSFFSSFPESKIYSSAVAHGHQKMRKMLGVMSNGLILCARDAALDIVQLLEPPQRAVVGERVQFGSRVIKQGRPVTPTTASRWKLWSEMQPLLKTGPDGAVAYNGQIMYTKAGPVKAPKVIKGSVTALVWRELKPEEAEAHAQRLQQSARAASNEPAPAVL
eukprot:evm.model.scf_9.9 EVM.evm.TU.scf_9.9   scf_9:150805-152579(+)